MDPQFRAPFNQQFTDERYQWYQNELSRRLGCTFEFRLAETPLFIPDDFKAKLVDAAKAIVHQLSDPTRLARMKQAIPARWDTPGMDGLPSFTQVDFAVVRGADGSLEPKLIELQGFPTVACWQALLTSTYQNHFPEIPANFTPNIS